jgi:hypothetical protein
MERQNPDPVDHTEKPTPVAAAVGLERRLLVDQARKAWADQLIDRSRRNNLLYFRDLKTGTLDLSAASAEALSSLLEGAPVPLSRLLPVEADEARSLAMLREIQRRALSNLEEKGLETLYLAMGMASWPVADGGRPPEAAVLLIPLTVEWRGRESRAASLRRSGEVQLNLVLLHALEVEHGCRVAAEALLEPAGVNPAADPAPPDGPAETGLDVRLVFQRLHAAAREVRGFAIRERAVLGNFTFQKMAMVKDLQELEEPLAAHDLIAALAGDANSQALVRGAGADCDPREFDRALPEDEYLIRDADASQQAVVAAVRSGRHVVIQGPPGTGKSQTIANLIATLTALGRRVLFVAEKRAALEVVLERLEEAGLGHLALDLHGADLSRRAVMDRLGRTLQRVRDARPVQAEPVHQRFTEARARLNEHVHRLHAPRSPAGKSVYDLQGWLLRAAPAAPPGTRWRGPELERLDAPSAAAVDRLLREAAGFGGLVTGDHPSPWTGAFLPDGAAVQQAADTVSRLLHARWPEADAALRALVAAAGLPPPATLAQGRTLIALAQEVSRTLECYSPEIFRQDLPALTAALAPAGEGPWRRSWAFCTNSGFRRARAAVRSLRGDCRAPDSLLLEEITAAADQAQRWRALSPQAPFPSAPLAVEPASRAWTLLHDDVASLAVALRQPDLDMFPLPDLMQLVADLAADPVTPHRLPRLLQIEQGIGDYGAEAILREIRARRPDPSGWAACFEHAWLASCLDHARLLDPQIAGFNGRTHDQVVEQYRRSDEERVKLAAARVCRAHAESVIRVMNAHPDQEALVKREIEKRARHLPLRALLAKAPEVLTALAPCWMASPLSVSQLLPGDRCYFDVVIFDEASQVLPHDAVPSLLRAAQAVVAGDEHQLPPTLFFADGGEEEADPAAPTAGFESLLQLMRPVVGAPLALQWHYRSRDESLIAFSNHHIYRPHGQEMITFPGPRAQGAVTHFLVEQVLGQEEEEESGAAEVQRVVELVIEHAERCPDETLGVIAMGIKHANRVQAALDDALCSRPDLDPFFDESRPDRFFVKNLERVQGDERDAIILTVGYGKDPSGKLPYRFGPLNQEGGERRLNVAVTRARRRLTVVSSFSHHDMDPGRSNARGVELLRRYLEFAAGGGRLPAAAGPCDIPLNDLETDIVEALTRRGIPLVARWGASRSRIDQVAQHPDRPDRFVLALELDGPTYYQAPTARDRDRLRPQHLAALGWRLHRIWSTDWFMRREEEIERAWAAYQAAVAHADQEDARSEDAPPPNGHKGSEGPGAGSPLPLAGRGPRPLLPQRESITGFHPHELHSLVHWIESDGRLRTDDELITELVKELGFQKRGARIEAVLRDAIEHVRSQPAADLRVPPLPVTSTARSQP